MKDLSPCYEISRSGNKEFEKLTFVNFSTRLLSSLIWLLFPIAIIVSVHLMKNNSDLAEWYTQTFSRAYTAVISKFTGWFPFSLTEIFFLTFFVIVIITIIVTIRLFITKKWISGISKIITLGIVITSIIANYDLSCEFAYKRKAMNIPYYTRQVDNEEFKDIYNYFAADMNYCISQLDINDDGVVHKPMNIYGVAKAVNKAYDIVKDNPYFFNNRVLAKPMITSLVYREFQITGMTFNSFAESNVNYLCTDLELPLTVAHELAHLNGVMREDDANQLAFYICLNSDDAYLRFSAYGLYFYQMTLLTSDVYMDLETRKELTPVSPKYFYCRNYAYNYWKKHDLMSKIGDWFNNQYIKSSGVEEGTSSYEGGTESHDTPDPEDPEIIRLVASKYQQLFFEKYYRNK